MDECSPLPDGRAAPRGGGQRHGMAVQVGSVRTRVESAYSYELISAVKSGEKAVNLWELMVTIPTQIGN